MYPLLLGKGKLFSNILRKKAAGVESVAAVESPKAGVLLGPRERRGHDPRAGVLRHEPPTIASRYAANRKAYTADTWSAIDLTKQLEGGLGNYRSAGIGAIWICELRQVLNKEPPADNTNHLPIPSQPNDHWKKEMRVRE